MSTYEIDEPIALGTPMFKEVALLSSSNKIAYAREYDVGSFSGSRCRSCSAVAGTTKSSQPASSHSQAWFWLCMVCPVAVGNWTSEIPFRLACPRRYPHQALDLLACSTRGELGFTLQTLPLVFPSFFICASPSVSRLAYRTDTTCI